MFRKIRDLFRVFREFGFPRIKNFQELWGVITWVNRGMHTFAFDKELLAAAKDELIIHLLKKYRNRVEVGYLVGGTRREVEYIYDELDVFDLSVKLEEEYGKDLIKFAPVWSEGFVIYHVVDWDKVERFSRAALSKNFQELKDDFYGLIEIRNGNATIHAIAPRIEKFSPFIGKFDYLTLRWQVYPLHAGRKTLETIEDMNRFLHAIWKAQRISKAARRYVRENFRRFLWVINNAPAAAILSLVSDKL